jgi:hypothetical protein
MLNIAKDIHSLSDFKRNTPELLDQMRESGRPAVLTIDGRAEITVPDAASYRQRLARAAVTSRRYFTMWARSFSFCPQNISKISLSGTSS